jgi:23S rRNA pseudouridine1911/1915/1917 synthase
MSAPPLRLSVPEAAAGARLDAFLAARDPSRTRSAWKRIIEGGAIAIDGRPTTKAGFPLKSGMAIEVELPETGGAALTGEDIPIPVAFEDEHLAVIVKPAGLTVHPGHGRTHGTLVHALAGQGMALAPAGGTGRPGIVHRLDKDTSGLLLIAKTDAAHRALVGMFSRREIKKTYRALVWGRPHPAAGRIDETIGRSRRDPTRMTVRAPRGREATTIYRTEELLRGFTLLDVDLVTGRTHQIRVHFASLKHPVVGDTRYGGAPWRGMRDTERRRAIARFDRLGLHAAALAFVHPITGAAIALESPLPEEFAELLRALREPA